MSTYQTITLKTTAGALIYSGLHCSIKDAVETAYAKGIPLNGINLCGADLRQITLDDICLKDANLKHADLTGANLSEATFDNCSFQETRLIDACLCYSTPSNCDFSQANLGGTDIAECFIENSLFSANACLTLDFDSCFKTINLHIVQNGRTLTFKQPPIVLKIDNERIILIPKEYQTKKISKNNYIIPIEMLDIIGITPKNEIQHTN